jgi:hypothetical protein
MQKGRFASDDVAEVYSKPHPDAEKAATKLAATTSKPRYGGSDAERRGAGDQGPLPGNEFAGWHRAAILRQAQDET